MMLKARGKQTMTAVDIGTLIIRSPEICGNRPRIAGTRMTVGRIATLWQQGLSTENIQSEYPHLKLAQIYAALAYYHANRDAIDQALAQDQADYEQCSQMYSQPKESIS
jgi:uncharacterized protein (DUF433 family)